jgi:hypothetical protein
VNGIDDSNEPIVALLAVDAVPFRPTITVDEFKKMEGIQGTDHLEHENLSTQFMIDPAAFQDFVKENFDQAYTSLFVYQIQRLDRKLTYCVVYANPAVNGKGNRETIVGLQSILEMVGSSIFKTIGYAFDGDSCFSGLQTEFRKT